MCEFHWWRTGQFRTDSHLGRGFSREAPRVSGSRHKDAKPPTNVKPLVTKSKSRTLLSSEPLTNCAAIEPRRPADATIPMPDVRTVVGNDSVEATSNAFQPHVLNALKRQPPETTTAAPELVPNAKRDAEAAASVIDRESRRRGPT